MRLRYGFVVIAAGLTVVMMGSGPPEYGGEAVCGDGVLQPGEQCDGGTCCTTSCAFASAATMCRAAIGSCDVAESCTGASSVCPADAFASGACGNACHSGTCVGGRCAMSVVHAAGTPCTDASAPACISSATGGAATCDGFGECVLGAPN